jgi:Transposase IS116/IS110/IS902 family
MPRSALLEALTGLLVTLPGVADEREQGAGHRPEVRLEASGGEARFSGGDVTLCIDRVLNEFRLAFLPGVNVIVAASFLAAIGDVARFESPRKLVGYLGLDPRVRPLPRRPAEPGPALRSAAPVLRNPLNRNRAVALTLGQCKYGWANALIRRGQGALRGNPAVQGP